MEPIHTVDIVVTDGKSRVLLVERGKEPFKGKLVLPGGHVDAADYELARRAPHDVLTVPPEFRTGHFSRDEAADPMRALAERIAASRELQEEAGIAVLPGELNYMLTLKRPGRDPRGNYVSSLYGLGISRERLAAARAGSDAKRVVLRDWETVEEHEMGFDHYDAILLLQD
jgi:8-oxo-dGTP diphosphatase